MKNTQDGRCKEGWHTYFWQNFRH